MPIALLAAFDCLLTMYGEICMSDGSLNKIMLVEDEPDIQQIAQLALEAVGGFTVKICSSGKEALEDIGEFSPDLVLMDVMMPEMDGPSTLAALKNNPATASVPVIFMTAKVQPQDVAAFKDAGAIDVISKPFDPMSLAETVEAIWQQNAD